MIIEKIPISKLREASYNPRLDLKPGDAEYEKIKRSIEEFDLVEPLVWNRTTGNLVGGHQRLKVLKEKGVKEVEVSIVEISDLNREKALNIALNKVQGDWDNEKLNAILLELKMANFDLTLTGFDMPEFETMTHWSGEEGKTEEDDLPEKAPSVCKEGDLWQLGNGRILCGDSTIPGNYSRLFKDLPPPVLMVTDPPYGVEYDPSWREGHDLGGLYGDRVGKRSKGKVMNDDRLDWTEAYKLFTGDIAYIWHAGKYGHLVAKHLESCGFEIINQIIWAKQHFVLSRGDYHWKHEPCLYVVKKGKDHNWQGPRDQSTIWEIQNNNSFGNQDREETWGHGTQKPVECMLRPIKNNSKEGDIVYDPFLGSGTTLIASEKMRRIGVGMELNPKYCDIIIARWENFTGKKGVRVDA